MCPRDAVGKSQRLVARARGQRIGNSRKIRQANARHPVVDWIGRNAINSQKACDICTKGIVAQHLRPAAAPIQLHGLHQMRRPVMPQPQCHRLIQRGSMAPQPGKHSQALRAHRIQIVSAVQIELRIDCVEQMHIQRIAVQRRRAKQLVVIYRLPGDVRQRNVRKQALCSRIERHAGVRSKVAAEWRLCPCRTRRWRVKLNA